MKAEISWDGYSDLHHVCIGNGLVVALHVHIARALSQLYLIL
jgi:hypothetical protein